MRYPSSFFFAAVAAALGAPGGRLAKLVGEPLDPHAFCRALPRPTFSRHPNVAARLRRKEARRRAALEARQA